MTTELVIRDNTFVQASIDKVLPHRIGYYDLSLEIVIVGARGGGKTLLMSGLQVDALRRTWVINKLRELKGYKIFPRQKAYVWSNYPVKIFWTPHFVDKPILLASDQLDIDKLVVWDKMFHDCIINYDEIDQVADRQDWFTTVSKFLNAGVQIIRHRNISLVLTIQSLEWLNARLQWQADIIIKCRDLAFTGWGRKHTLGLGEVINTTWIDKSGIMTGQSFEESNRIYQRQYLAKRYHGSYSSEHEFNIIEHKTKKRIILPENIIDMSGRPEQKEGNEKALNNAVAYFLYNNQLEVKTFDLWDKAMEFGFEGEHNQYGQYLRSLGIEQKGSGMTGKFILGGVQVES